MNRVQLEESEIYRFYVDNSVQKPLVATEPLALSEMPVIRTSDGRDRWMEVRSKRLPKGGQKFTFAVRSILWIMSGTTLIFYGMLQADYNPESIWGRIYSKIVNYDYSAAMDDSRDDYAEEKKKRNLD